MVPDASSADALAVLRVFDTGVRIRYAAYRCSQAAPPQPKLNRLTIRLLRVDPDNPADGARSGRALAATVRSQLCLPVRSRSGKQNLELCGGRLRGTHRRTGYVWLCRICRRGAS